MWLEEITVWFNSALQSGMLALGGLSSAGIFASVKAWVGNLGLSKSVSSLQSTVLTQEQMIKDSNDRIRNLENMLAISLKAQEGSFIAINKLAQGSSIIQSTKDELIQLSTTIMPIFKTPEQINQTVQQLGVSITQPLTEAQKLLEAQKASLQTQATAKVDEAKSLLEDTFAKMQTQAVNLLDTAKQAITGDKVA